MGHPLLAEVFDRITHTQKFGGTPLVVFDLDGTLLRTGGRHLAILQEFADAADPALSGIDALRVALTEITAEDFGYFVTGPLLDRGIENSALNSALLDYWSVRYFSNRYCGYDKPAPGAQDFVNAVKGAGALIWYATSRPEPTMGVGTRTSLLQHDFPLDEMAALAMRGDLSQSDVDFKEAIVAAAAQVHLVAQFENEPANANLFATAWPDALHFLVGDVHSPDPPEPLPGIIHTDDFVLPA
jgi:hypothetical protein